MRRARTWEEREFGLVRRGLNRSPARTVAVAFAVAVVVGTLLLMLPASRSGPGRAGVVDALFTATSAVCVTGLSAVDVPSYWSTTGHVVILGLIQAGGLGMMALASLLGLLVVRRMGLRSRINAAAESNTLALGDVREVLRGVVKVTFATEAVIALVLALRFWLAYDEQPLRALWLGVFHSVSSFNNAGFALFSDSLMSFADDPFVLLPLNVSVILGGIGFPVLFELRRSLRRPRTWSLHTQLTVWGSLALLVAGWVILTALEWRNAATLGSFDAPSRVLAGLTLSVQPRTAGFNVVDYAEMGDPALLVTTLLMFIGGGSAGTAGGVKVATFFLLLFVIVAEVRGERDVEVARRRIEPRAQRQALTVALLAVGVVNLATLALMSLEPLSMGEALFEVVSAFATVGLTAGVTSTLGDPAQVLLVALMFVGRVGTVTLVSALALRERPHLYRLPEGRPLIG